jgi:hypothetical protein
MDTNVNITVMYSLNNDAWESMVININPKDFIDAKSKDLFIKNKVKSQLLGEGENLSIDYKYNLEQARKDIGES